MKIVIEENQRGLLFKNGRFIEYLKPGKHKRFGRAFRVALLHTAEEFCVENFSLDVFMKDQTLVKDLELIHVENEHIALHFIDGKFAQVLTSGKYAFWNVHETHTFQIVDIKNAEVTDDIPKYLFAYIPAAHYLKVEVADFQRALLTYDGKFVRLLQPGTYYFWKNSINVAVYLVDTRAQLMDIAGQEILTRDKVSLRINFVCSYKITDYVKIHTEITDFERQIYIALQLALREYVGKYRLDEILENKNQMGEAILLRLREKQADYFVTFEDAGVKDIILPGEIREIMNTVLVAEKKAQANVITRREEVASTRSLLNTAKLMEENKTLYKLKELEFLERICDNVGNISLGGGGDLLTQLTQILKGTQPYDTKP